MSPETALQEFLEVIRWSGGAELGKVLAALSIAAFIVWFAWIILAQLPRLQSGEITLQTLMAETGRALLVVLGVTAIVAFMF